MKKVLFVCLGNICRSPTAEGVFESVVNKAGLSDKIKIDSCGTSDNHSGEKADPRMMKHARLRGYELKSIARGINPNDLEEFDYIITMDDSNFSNVMALSSAQNKNKIKKMTDFCEKHNYSQVPDPYYGGAEGFETVLDLIEDASEGLLIIVKKDLKL
jgi:protein-tyrosine phosphatase